MSATRDDGGVCRSGCCHHRGTGSLPGARDGGCHTSARWGWPGSPAPVGSSRDGGLGGHSYLIFEKGISYFCTFLYTRQRVHPGIFILCSRSLLWACAPPISRFTPFSSSRTCFLQHLLRTPPFALPCPLPPTAALATKPTGDADIAPVTWGFRGAEPGGPAGRAEPWGAVLGWHCT